MVGWRRDHVQGAEVALRPRRYAHVRGETERCASTVLLTLGENRYRDHITTRTARYSGAVHVPVHLYCTIEVSSITRDQNYSVPLVTRVIRVIQ